MNYFHALLYGIIQGITEFLPVSSSAHLALMPYFLAFKDPGVSFDLFMHVGTALSVLVYFRKECLELFYSLLGKTKSQTPAFLYIITTLATVILVFILKDTSENYARGVPFIAANLFFFGIVLYFSDRIGEQNEEQNEEQNNANSNSARYDLEKFNKNSIVFAVAIGLTQALAIFPGVSRSGITISCARFFGFSREKASSYSFLLSLPVILGGMVFKIPDFLSSFDSSHSVQSLNFKMASLALITSFVVGVLTIHFFLKLLKKIGFIHFMIYRALLAIVLFWTYYQ